MASPKSRFAADEMRAGAMSFAEERSERGDD